MKKTIQVVIFLFLITHPLISLPKILVDCVHGFDHVEHLQTITSNYEFERLDEEDFPIENIIIQGELPNPDSTNFQEFYVPENTEHLYIITDDYDFNQDYFAYLEDPGGELVRPFQGILEIENPLSGTWCLFNENGFGMIEPFNYTIGTGPNFFESIDIWQYDAYYRLWNETWYFFLGPIQEYSSSEEQILQEWIDNGLGFLSYYNCLFDFVAKPVIRLYELTEPVEVRVSFEGVTTYQSPIPEITRNNGLTSYTWSNIKPKEEYAELLYEIGKIEPPRFLNYQVMGNRISIQNQSPYSVYGLYCLKSNHNNTFEIADFSNLNSGQKKNLHTQTITKAKLEEELKEKLPVCMTSRGLPAEQSEEFFLKYSWVERLFRILSSSDDYLTIYLIDTESYNGLFPLELTESPKEMIRQLWIVDKSISFAKSTPFQEIPNELITLSENGFSYYEYGLYPIEHNRETSSLFDLTIHNDNYIIDPTNYFDLEEAPIFHTFGNNEIAEYLTAYGWVEQVYNYHAPYIDFSEDWSPVLLGDEDCYTYSGNPEIMCCLVGKNQDFGRILVGGTSHLIDYYYLGFYTPSNQVFINNCLSWITFQDQVIEVPQDYTTINEAIDAAEPGFTIIVDDGTYNESINFDGKDITLESKYGNENCIITPPGGEPAIILENGETSQAILDGFTITGATVQAIFIENASATIQDNLIINNQMGIWYLNGAGIYCSNSSAIIENNEIAFNTEGYHGGGIYLDNWDGELINNEIHHNITNAGYGIDYGSGLCLVCSSGYVENNLIYGNDSNYVASSFCCYSTISVIEYNQIIENGNIGIKIVGNVMPIINNNDIYGNSLYDVYVTVEDSTEVIDFQYNYWGESTTNEMETLPFPSNITAIYDFLDDDELAFADYNNWLNSSVVVENESIQSSLSNLQLSNYPNPFNPTTTISFSVPEERHAEISIYNIKGQKVKQLLSDQLSSGEHSVVWNGRDKNDQPVSSGVYLYKLIVNGKTEAVKKCLLLK